MSPEEKMQQEHLRELLVETLVEEAEERRRQPRVGAAERRREWNVVTRFNKVFHALWILVIGIFIAALVIFMIFVVTGMLFHLDLSRYFAF